MADRTIFDNTLDAVSVAVIFVARSPYVKSLSHGFISELSPLMDSFPNENEASPIAKKFTLTIASEGFGIGMHKVSFYKTAAYFATK